MSAETKAVVFNAVPLFAVAAAYLAVAVAVGPRLWRERAGLTANDLALGLMFPCIGIPAAILGAAVLDSRNAIGGLVRGEPDRAPAGARLPGSLG